MSDIKKEEKRSPLSCAGNHMLPREGVQNIAGHILDVKGAEFWLQNIPISHQEAVKILTRDLPENIQIQITLTQEGAGEISIEKNGVFTEEKSTFSILKKEWQAGMLWIEPTYRGSGLGRHLLRNQLEYFYICGIQRLNIVAACIGSYAWARQGFLPDDVLSKDFKESTQEKILKRWDLLQTFLDEKDKAILNRALEFKDPHDMWTIADCKKDIANRLCAAFNIAIGIEKHKLQRLFMEIEYDWKQGGDLTLGKAILTSVGWIGHLDMGDKEQVERAGKYVGGWKYVKEPGT